MRFFKILTLWILFVGSSFCFACQVSAQQNASNGRTLTFKGVADMEVLPNELVYQEFFFADGDDENEMAETIKGYQTDIRNALKADEFKEAKISFSSADQGGTGAFGANNLPGFFVPNHIRNQNGSEFQSRQLVKVVVSDITKENFQKKCDMMRKIYRQIRESEVPLGNPNQNRNLTIYRGMIQDNLFRSKIHKFSDWDKLSSAAFADAKKKAEVMAKIAGGKVGKVISVATQGQAAGNNRSGYPMVYSSPYQYGVQQARAATVLSDMQHTPRNVFTNGLAPHRFVVVLEVKFELVD